MTASRARAVWPAIGSRALSTMMSCSDATLVAICTFLLRQERAGCAHSAQVFPAPFPEQRHRGVTERSQSGHGERPDVGRRSDVRPFRMLVDPMLATSGPLPADEERWAFEPKWDGFRAIVHTRRPAAAGHVAPGHGPRRTAPRAGAAGRVAPGGHRPRRRAGRRRPGRAGRLRRDAPPRFRPGGARPAALRRLRRAGPRRRGRHGPARGMPGAPCWSTSDSTGPAWCITPAYPGEGATLFEATRAEGIEGVVAKRLDAPYRPGVRTRAWVKTKHFDRAPFDVLGVAPTPEERYALLLGPARRRAGPLRRPGRMGVHPGAARGARHPGPADRREPLRGLGAAGVVFFQPGVVAEVRYLAGSQLRHATLVDNFPIQDTGFPTDTRGRERTRRSQPPGGCDG